MTENKYWIYPWEQNSFEDGNAELWYDSYGARIRK